MDGPWKVFFEVGNGQYNELIKELSDSVQKSIWYYHPNGKHGKGPHIHGLIYDWPKTDETCRNLIKKKLNLSTQGTFAVSNRYERGTKMNDMFVKKYITYMSKGKFDPIFQKGYDNEYVNECKSEWVDNVSVNTQVVITEKKPRMTMFVIAQLAEAEYLSEIGISEQCQEYRVTRMIKIVAKLLKNNKMLCHKRTVANIVQHIQESIDPAVFYKNVYAMV